MFEYEYPEQNDYFSHKKRTDTSNDTRLLKHADNIVSDDRIVMKL